MAKKLKLQKLGLKFQEIRSDNNLSIEEVSKKINVNTKFLKAIEDDNYDVFPARTFAKAYYYKYADFLKISDEFPVKLKAESIQSKKTNKRYKQALSDGSKDMQEPGEKKTFLLPAGESGPKFARKKL